LREDIIIDAGVVVGVVSAGIVVGACVVVTTVAVVTRVAGDVEEDGDGVVVLPQRECRSWLVPENMISSATVDVDARPAELPKTTENCEVFWKRNETA